jgi:hypothetical protein
LILKTIIGAEDGMPSSALFRMDPDFFVILKADAFFASGGINSSGKGKI